MTVTSLFTDMAENTVFSKTRIMTLFRKANRLRRWQTNVSKLPSYQSVDARFFYRRGRGGETK